VGVQREARGLTGMARPRDIEKSKDLARRAVEVLERHGLTVSAEHLARELDVKRPTLLYHFPTHGHIVQAALAELLMEQAAFVEERVAKHEHPIDRMYARLCAVHDFHRGRETRLLFLTQAIAVTAGGRAAEIITTASELFANERRDIVARIERGIEEGIVHPCDAKALVSLMRAVIDGLTIQRVVSPRTVPAVHEIFWKTVLEPLKRQEKKQEKKRKK
jgi:AcrR family transcriptional regulator